MCDPGLREQFVQSPHNESASDCNNTVVHRVVPIHAAKRLTILINSFTSHSQVQEGF